MNGAALRSFDHAPVGSQQPSNDEKHQAEPKDERDYLVAEDVEDGRRSGNLAAHL
jgi:hypothetical protein